jgi:hypothetical protein
MSPSSSTDLDYSNKFATLTGQNNFIRWLRDLKAVCESKDLWKLITGEETLLDKPERPTKP